MEKKKEYEKSIGILMAVSHSQTAADIIKLQHIRMDVLIKSKIDKLSYQEQFFGIAQTKQELPLWPHYLWQVCYDIWVWLWQ